MLETRHSKHWKDVLKKTSDMMLDLGNGKALKKEDFEKVSVPVKIILGENDKMVSREESLQISEYIPHSKFTLLPNSEHPIEKADLNLLKTEILSF